MTRIQRAVAVGSFLALVALTRQASAQTPEQFAAARDIVVVASVAQAYQCPGLDRTLFAILQHAEAVGPGERRCAALAAALHCVTAPGRVGLPLRAGGFAFIDVSFARFRQDSTSLAFGAAIAAALEGMADEAGC